MRKHEFTFKATLAKEGKKYKVEVENEMLGPFTVEEIAQITMNLIECFRQSLITTMKETIDKANPISNN